MLKKEARKKFLQLRTLLSDQKVFALSKDIYIQWKNSLLSQFDSYHIFLSILEKREVDTSIIIKHLWDNKNKVYCSKVDGNALLHYELSPETILKKNTWGIPEPSNQSNLFIKNIECIFIPLLAYDFSGNRVGYGKGYYDSFLQKYSSSIKVGLSFFDPIDSIDDYANWDVPLDYIITPTYSSSFPIEVK